MNNAIREQVLGVVAGLRGEKRAAEAYVAGFSKAAELLGVDPVRLAKQAQQLQPPQPQQTQPPQPQRQSTLAAHKQRRIAEMKAMAAKLRAGTPPASVTTNGNGVVTSTWRGYVPPQGGIQPQP